MSLLTPLFTRNVNSTNFMKSWRSRGMSMIIYWRRRRRWIIMQSLRWRLKLLFVIKLKDQKRKAEAGRNKFSKELSEMETHLTEVGAPGSLGLTEGWQGGYSEGRYGIPRSMKFGRTLKSSVMGLSMRSSRKHTHFNQWKMLSICRSRTSPVL